MVLTSGAIAASTVSGFPAARTRAESRHSAASAWRSKAFGRRRDLRGLQARRLQHRGDDLEEIRAALLDGADEAPLLLAQLAVRAPQEHLREAEDRVERGAELVRDAGQELRLDPVGLEQAGVGFAQVARSRRHVLLETLRLLDQDLLADLPAVDLPDEGQEDQEQAARARQGDRPDQERAATDRREEPR